MNASGCGEAESPAETPGPAGGAAVSVDPAEAQKFAAMAEAWWDPEGQFKPLHMMNPCRLDYLTRQITAEFGRDPAAMRPLEGLRLLDIGCGGGLLCEPMARLGAAVTGADPVQASLEVARLHAGEAGLDIDYRAATAEALAAEGLRFDVVLNMEVVEHVAEPEAFLATCRGLVAPGGLMIASTINRTAKSFALAKVGAEYLLCWLPRGTHDWRRFLTPDELFGMLQAAGLDPVDRKGLVFDPLAWRWRLSAFDLSVNYVTTSVRRAEA